jgi:hypothetical protein
MSVQRNEMDLSKVFPDGHEILIRIMNAFGFKADRQGVCCGLSHSARDAFLSGGFPRFLEYLHMLLKIHEACVNEVKSTISEAQKQELAEIEKLTARRKSPELSFEKKHHITMIINYKAVKLKKILNSMSDYSDDPINSNLAQTIMNSVGLKIDVVLQAKLSVISELSDESGDVEINAALSTLANLSYLTQLQKIEVILQKLSNNPGIKIKLAEKLKQKLTTIPENNLNLLNSIQALCTRITLYQKANNYADIFNQHDLSGVQTENVKHVHPLVKSAQLEVMGGLENVVSFTGCYTVAELTVYFKTLMEFLNSFHKPAVLNLGSSNHAIMMGYEPADQSFMFYNPGTRPVTMKDPAELAKSVISALSKRNIYVAHSLRDVSNLQKYQNHYLAIQDPQSLFYVNAKGDFQKLKINNQEQFQKAIADFLGGETPENQTVEVLQQIILANAGHESLGSSVAIMTTDFAILAEDNSASFSEHAKQWYQRKLAGIQEVTPEKIAFTDAAEAGWFQRALASNDLDTVKNFLAHSVKVSYYDLVDAINNKFSELVTLLLPHVKIPLVLAAYKSDINVVRELLKNKVDINQAGNGLCALAVAVINDNVPLVEVLLEHGANPHHAYPSDAETPFSLALNDENIVIQALFNNLQLAESAIKNVENDDKPSSLRKGL